MLSSDVPQSGSFTITCPSCGKEWNTLRVERRARTCPSCGHVGPRAAFKERPTSNGETPAEETPEMAKQKADDRAPAKRKLAGAAAAAHEAKQRGEPVTVGKPFGGDRAPTHAAKKKTPQAASSSSTPAKSLGILDRLKRVVI